jgi:hypothetical protein
MSRLTAAATNISTAEPTAPILPTAAGTTLAYACFTQALSAAASQRRLSMAARTAPQIGVLVSSHSAATPPKSQREAS